ncbi:MAG: ABC transporter permease [Gammaproteobacteria bacterium]|nr:ABC transporter permease [Gammaproteobacteria bacterium]
MTDFSQILNDSINLIFNLNHEYVNIILTSMIVSFFAIILSLFLSLPIAAFLSIANFKGKSLILIMFNSLMALPPVVVGLILYLLLSSQGIFSSYNLLYTVQAMIIAQTIIITPIMVSLSVESIDYYKRQYFQLLQSLHASIRIKILTLMWESRSSLLINMLAGLGRSLSEVGAIIIVGGNIAELTRTMTTGIVLETSRGELTIALSLGITLIAISISINIAAYIIKQKITYE